MHREAAEQHQRGHDQETTADADEPGDHADDEAVHRDLPERPWRVLAAVQLHRTQHEPRGDQHDDSEQCQLHDARDPGRDEGASVGADHARYAERRDAAPVDEARAQELQAARERDAADDEQRAGYRDFLVLADEVNEHRHRQYGAAGAEQTEAHANCDGARPRHDGCEHHAPRERA